MRKTRAPGLLARRTDVCRKRYGHYGIRTIDMKNYLQSVREGEFFVVNLECSFGRRLLGETRIANRQEADNEEASFCDFHKKYWENRAFFGFKIEGNRSIDLNDEQKRHKEKAGLIFRT